MTLHIRAMTTADLDAVTEIEAQVTFDTPWGKNIFSDCLAIGYGCWVLEDTQQRDILGFGLISSAANEAHILNICIRSDKHRQGLGSLMFTKLLTIAQAANAHRVYLEVASINEPAIKFYEKWGFSQIGVRHQYYHAPTGKYDAIVMAMDLKNP